MSRIFVCEMFLVEKFFCFLCRFLLHVVFFWRVLLLLMCFRAFRTRVSRWSSSQRRSAGSGSSVVEGSSENCGGTDMWCCEETTCTSLTRRWGFILKTLSWLKWRHTLVLCSQVHLMSVHLSLQVFDCAGFVQRSCFWVSCCSAAREHVSRLEKNICEVSPRVCVCVWLVRILSPPWSECVCF